MTHLVDAVVLVWVNNVEMQEYLKSSQDKYIILSFYMSTDIFLRNNLSFHYRVEIKFKKGCFFFFNLTKERHLKGIHNMFPSQTIQ